MRQGIIRIASILGIAASLGACAGVDASDSLEDSEVPSVLPQGGRGSTGSNGLGGALFLGHQSDLINATRRPLVGPGTDQVNPATAADFLSTEDGKVVFRYAMACALPAGSTVQWGDVSFVGLGHLSTTGSWREQALPTSALLDLLACMIAHVNENDGVPIVLSGPSVSYDELDHSSFDVDEARWIARLGQDGTLQYVVWPSPTISVPSCASSNDPMTVLTQRVCGRFQGHCPLVQGSETDCTSGDDGYTCLGQPAILTTLKEEDVPRRFCF